MAHLVDVKGVLARYPKEAGSNQAQSVLGRLKGGVNADLLADLNTILQPTAFYRSQQLSVDDLHLYATLHAYFASSTDADRLAVTNLTRWFDTIQHLPGVASSLSLSIVQINRNYTAVVNAAKKPAAPAAKAAAPAAKVGAASPAKSEAPAAKPKQAAAAEKKQQPPKEKKQPTEEEKAAAAKAKTERAAAAKAAAAAQPKQERAPKAGGAKQQPATAADPRTDIEHIDIRVGKITSVKRHPNADALYVEEIDLGEGKPRTIISGLVNFVPIEEMENRRVLVLANLKPRAMRGIESHGMVLCTSNSDKSKVEPLLVPEGVEVGERIFFGDTPSAHAPDAELNPKKKYFESVQPDWKTKDDKIAYYKDLPFNTPKGPITTASIAGGTIS